MFLNQSKYILAVFTVLLSLIATPAMADGMSAQDIVDKSLERNKFGFQNAIAADAAFEANNIENAEAVYMGPGNHNECILPSLSDVYYWFDTLRSPCQESGLQYLKTEHVELFPNPVSDELQVMIKSPGKHELLVLDGFGRSVYHLKEISGNTSIALSDFESGVYFVEVRSSDHSVIQKIIKE